MKNIINYFYNLKIKEYKKNNSKFVFIVNGVEYEFTEYYGDINTLTRIYNIIKSQGKKCHEIIINRNNMIVTPYENKQYILLKKTKYSKLNDFFHDIISYDAPVLLDEKLKWKRLWCDKLDYYNHEIIEKKNTCLKYSFSYYSSLCESAISLLNFVDERTLKFGISHVRIENEEDLITPLNIIIDSRVRDIAEYIKIQFFKNNKIYSDVFDLIRSQYFSKDEAILLIARLLYPSYFFDRYEFFSDYDLQSEKLQNIIKKNSEYENFLKKIYREINIYYNIPQIEFLEI